MELFSIFAFADIIQLLTSPVDRIHLLTASLGIGDLLTKQKMSIGFWRFNDRTDLYNCFIDIISKFLQIFLITFHTSKPRDSLRDIFHFWMFCDGTVLRTYAVIHRNHLEKFSQIIFDFSHLLVSGLVKGLKRDWLLFVNED